MIQEEIMQIIACITRDEGKLFRKKKYGIE
jgi:hypothetical protein